MQLCCDDDARVSECPLDACNMVQEFATDDTLALAQAHVAQLESKLGSSSVSLATALHKLAALVLEQAKSEGKLPTSWAAAACAARPLLEKALHIREAKFGEVHLLTAESLGELGRVIALASRSEHDAAASLLRRAIAARRRWRQRVHRRIGEALPHRTSKLRDGDKSSVLDSSEDIDFDWVVEGLASSDSIDSRACTACTWWHAEAVLHTCLGMCRAEAMRTAQLRLEALQRRRSTGGSVTSTTLDEEHLRRTVADAGAEAESILERAVRIRRWLAQHRCVYSHEVSARCGKTSKGPQNNGDSMLLSRSVLHLASVQQARGGARAAVDGFCNAMDLVMGGEIMVADSWAETGTVNVSPQVTHLCRGDCAKREPQRKLRAHALARRAISFVTSHDAPFLSRPASASSASAKHDRRCAQGNCGICVNRAWVLDDMAAASAQLLREEDAVALAEGALQAHKTLVSSGQQQRKLRHQQEHPLVRSAAARMRGMRRRFKRAGRGSGLGLAFTGPFAGVKRRDAQKPQSTTQCRAPTRAHGHCADRPAHDPLLHKRIRLHTLPPCARMRNGDNAGRRTAEAPSLSRAAEGVVEEHVRGTLYRVRFSNNETTVMPRSSLVTKILQ